MKLDDSHFSQAVLPASKRGLCDSSAFLLALPAFLAKIVPAKNEVSETIGLKLADRTYYEALNC